MKPFLVAERSLYFIYFRPHLLIIPLAEVSNREKTKQNIPIHLNRSLQSKQTEEHTGDVFIARGQTKLKYWIPEVKYSLFSVFILTIKACTPLMVTVQLVVVWCKHKDGVFIRTKCLAS